MSKVTYCSILKNEICSFIKLRESQGFIDKHRRVLSVLDKYLMLIKSESKELSPQIVDDWLSKNYNEVTVNTLKNYIMYYNAFAKYLNSLGISAFIAETPTRVKSYVPYVFSKEEIEKIFQIADNKKGKLGNLTCVQFPMFLRILYGCGLRLNEALLLKLSDVDFENGILHIGKSKNKERLVPMDETLTNILKTYCSVILAGKNSNSYLFESDYNYGSKNCIGQPRAINWASKNFKHILKEAGIEFTRRVVHERGICMHCLRHTFTVNSFRNQDIAGVDNYRNTPSLSIYVGHKNLLYTQEYLHTTAENSEDIIAKTEKYSKGMFPEVPV